MCLLGDGDEVKCNCNVDFIWVKGRDVMWYTNYLGKMMKCDENVRVNWVSTST